MRVLNLYAGVGGNRALWPPNIDVTSVENYEPVAEVYAANFPQDELVVGDAHQYLLDEGHRFDFIWSSPPCQTHSRMAKATRHKLARYVDLTLYEEILFLQELGVPYVVENVRPWYPVLIPYTAASGRHLFWSDRFFLVDDVPSPPNFIQLSDTQGAKRLQEWLGISYDKNVYYKGNHCPCQIWRNAVHPWIGWQILRHFI